MSTVYSIKDIERLSGIKAHTLRIWEKRYGIIKPKRTQTNIRYFLDEDLKQILNIALLNKNGLKISKIAKLDVNELSAELGKIDQNQNDLDEVEAFNLAVLELNEGQCKRIFDRVIQRIGFENSIEEFIYPLLDRLSMLWISGSLKPVHESFVQTMIKNRVSYEIECIPYFEGHKTKFAIYLPENEDHELSMLFLNYILKSRGGEVINLGSSIKAEDLISACQIFKPDFTFTIINNSLRDDSLQVYVDFLSLHLPRVTHLYSGFQFVKQSIILKDNCKYVESLNAVQEYL